MRWATASGRAAGTSKRYEAYKEPLGTLTRAVRGGFPHKDAAGGTGISSQPRRLRRARRDTAARSGQRAYALDEIRQVQHEMERLRDHRLRQRAYIPRQGRASAADSQGIYAKRHDLPVPERLLGDSPEAALEVL